MSTQHAIETEVKIPVHPWTLESATTHLNRLNLRVTTPRLLEANFVLDDDSRGVRNAQMLLRLRRAGEKNVLTWKGASLPGPHKSRPELEVALDSFETMRQILENLGYRTRFRYEKYRTEFSGDAGSVVFDETPIGNFLELEGAADWIDRTAAQLGFSHHDYILDSYGRLYLAHCAENGIQPADMLFAASAGSGNATLV